MITMLKLVPILLLVTALTYTAPHWRAETTDCMCAGTSHCHRFDDVLHTRRKAAATQHEVV
jgi:hypothetical protein